MGYSNDDTPAPFIIELYGVFKQLFLGDVNKIQEDSLTLPNRVSEG